MPQAATGVTPRTIVHRIEVRSRAGQSDPRGDAALREAQSLELSHSPSRIDVTSVYLIEGQLEREQIERIAAELLADPVTEDVAIGASEPDGDAVIEVHPLPGVMDPDAEPVQTAIHAMLGVDVVVRTGRRYDFHGIDRGTARTIVERVFANTVIHAIHESPYHPDSFPHGREYELQIVEVPIRDLDDAGLEKLSREGHLFLSLEEMRAIQEEYRALGREPREIELETLAQTWSEHCVHKTLKATIRYREDIESAVSRDVPVAEGAAAGTRRLTFENRPGHVVNDDGSVTIHNLLKSTVAAATHELIEEGIDWCLSVFVDNAGIIAFDEKHAVCFKVETHNHPSAIEPYGGAATGIGGCIRDIIGTGLAAKPIAATDVFCVAHPDQWNGDQSPGIPMPGRALPAGCLHPRRILQQVVTGVRDYGNRMGIPTVNGAVWFDNDYVGNPLVYCGCVGVMPRELVKGEPQTGDRIIALGGRTGRDGIHGATFSSAELTDTHADEFSHAVQIGNPVTEKKMLDAILEARDHASGCLFNAITDCGAGGFSSAVGEMGEALGAEVHLERAPLKYAGLSPTEIWISEAQERMVLAVPADRVDALQAVCEKHDVEMCDLGHFGTPGRELVLHYHGTEVGRLPMEFLHEGLPQTVREAEFVCEPRRPHRASAAGTRRLTAIDEVLIKLLSHPNIASKRWIIQQYDHEVQGRTVIKPLVGPEERGPSDAAVITPVEDSTRGIGIACGLATMLRDDPYLMTLAAIDECVRNLVCVGVDPRKIAILDNFCWPSCKDPRNLGSLVRAAEACYDGAKAYRTPFISGKDSLNNQFTTEDGRTIQIPPTLLISGFGIVHDIRRAITMDAKRAGNALVLIGETQSTLASSHYESIFGGSASDPLPAVDLERGPQLALAVSRAIKHGIVRSAHDISDGGLLVAAAEMAFAGGLGLELDTAALEPDDRATFFGESPSRYLLEVPERELNALRESLGELPHTILGTFNDSARLQLGDALNVSIDALRNAWHRPLDW